MSKPDRVAFAIPPELRREAEAAIVAIRDDPGDRDHIRQLIGVVVRLTETGLDYFFIHPLELAGIGTVSLTTARMGVGAARAGIPRLVRRVVASMDDDQRLSIADFMDQILIRG